MLNTPTRRRTLAAPFTVILSSMVALLLQAGLAQADDARGEVLFDLCQQCHGPAGGGMEMALAPAIAGLDRWYVEAQLKNFKNGARGTHADDVGGLRMYPMSLWLRNDEDIAAVAGYVASLPREAPAPTVEGGNAAAGAKHYATVCATCHGADGAGNQTMNAPPLTGTSDWYLVESLHKFKAGIRGTNSNNPNAMLMRGMALTLVDDQAVRDVVAHITSLNQ